MPYIPDAYTDSTPAAAVLGNRLYVAFKDNDSDYIRLAWTEDPSDESSWTVWDLNRILHISDPPGPAQIRTSHGPALSVTGEALWLAFKGHNNALIWLVSMTEPTPYRRAWRGHGCLLDAQTARGPAMADSWVVHRGNRDDGIWYKVVGTPARGESSIPNTHTDDSPAVVWEASPAGMPVVVFRRPNNAIMFTHGVHLPGDLSRWTEPEPIPGAWSLQGPALAMHGDLLYVAFRSGTDDRIWTGSYDGRFWNLHGTVPNQYTSERPALVSFQDTLYVVCKGHNNDRVWYREVPVHSYSRVLEMPSAPGIEHFRPDPNGFAFTNFSEGIPDWGTFRDTFGHSEIDAAATGSIFDFFLTLGAAYGIAFWAFYGFYRDFTNGTRNTGMCSAYAACSLRRYWDGTTSTLFTDFPGVPDAHQLPRNIRRELTVVFGRLLGVEVLRDLMHQCERGLARVRTSLREIENDFLAGSGLETARILFFIPSGRVWDARFTDRLLQTHALVPYKIEYPAPGSTDPIRLYVYDCNHPGNNDLSYIEFIERPDRLLDFDFYTGDTASTLDTDLRSQNGFTLGTLTLDEYLFRDVDLPLDLGFILDILDSPAELRIRNRRGQLTGQKGGKIHWEIPGSYPVYPLPNAFLLPRGKYTREIQGTGKGPYTFCSLNPDGTSVLVHSTATGPARPSLDTLIIDRTAKKVIFRTKDATKRCNLALRSVDDKGIKMVVLSDVHLERGKPLTLGFSKKLEAVHSIYSGTSHKVGVQALHVPKEGGAVRTAKTRATLQADSPLQLKMSYKKRLSIKK